MQFLVKSIFVSYDSEQPSNPYILFDDGLPSVIIKDIGPETAFDKISLEYLGIESRWFYTNQFHIHEISKEELVIIPYISSVPGPLLEAKKGKWIRFSEIAESEHPDLNLIIEGFQEI